VARFVVPSAFSGPGIGAMGAVAVTDDASVTYDVALTNGFSSDVTADEGLRTARGLMESDDNHDKTVFGRIGLVPTVPFLDALDLGVGEDLDVGVPVALDELGRLDAHRAVVRGERLVELRHLAADGRRLLDQEDLEAGGRHVERGLDAADPAAHDHDVAERPRAVAVFAGALRYSRYPWWKRQMLRGFALMGGHDTDPSRDYEYTDWGAVAHFAEAFAASLAAPKA